MWGVVNTVGSYVLYLGLLYLVSYRWAYTIAFVTGILASYAVNTHFVFRGRWSWGRAARFPAVYVVQYLAGLALLWLLVERFGMDDRLAPLFVISVSVPLTYFMSKAIIGGERTP
jgi:putative flippase GtrA